jgi:cell division protease FtsH
MVLDWGMSEKFGNMAFGEQREQVFLGDEIGSGRDYSDSTAREIDQEVRRILQEAFDRAVEVLNENRDVLNMLADELLQKEEVPGSVLMQWLEDNGTAIDAGNADGRS